jgi:hypothetical protein
MSAPKRIVEQKVGGAVDANNISEIKDTHTSELVIALIAPSAWIPLLASVRPRSE